MQKCNLLQLRYAACGATYVLYAFAVPQHFVKQVPTMKNDRAIRRETLTEQVTYDVSMLPVSRVKKIYFFL